MPVMGSARLIHIWLSGLRPGRSPGRGVRLAGRMGPRPEGRSRPGAPLIHKRSIRQPKRRKWPHVSANLHGVLNVIGSFSGFTCPECGEIAPPLDDKDFDAYFRGGSWSCQKCGAQASILKLLTDAIRSDNPLLPGAVGLGAANSAFASITLHPDSTLELNLAELGVPEEAMVLGVSLTPVGVPETGVLIPATFVQQVTRASVPHVLHLFGRSLGEEAQPTTVNVLCTWLSDSVEPEMQPLMSAIEAYSEGDYRQAIVPASVAVEDKLGSVLRAHYMQFAGRDRSTGFYRTAQRSVIN
jgi:hypothetical protein